MKEQKKTITTQEWLYSKEQDKKTPASAGVFILISLILGFQGNHYILPDNDHQLYI